MRLDWDELDELLVAAVAGWLADWRKLYRPRHEKEFTRCCAVHTRCKQARHTEPPLCDCHAESKATPACDNRTQHNINLQPIAFDTELDKRLPGPAHSLEHITNTRGRIRGNIRGTSYHLIRALSAHGIRRKIARRRMSARHYLTSAVES